MSTLLVIGATSDIARATALKFALNGWDIQLAARNPEHLARIVQDISVRTGRKVTGHPFDVLQTGSARQLLASLPKKPDAALCAVGLLGEQQAAQHDAKLAEAIVTSNFAGLIPVLSLLADYFEAQGRGSIMGISSVAGDRGRASNYFYGSAKAGFTAFLSGLRNRLALRHVHVMTVKPGFVATRMTENMKLLPVLTASPDNVASAIWNGFRKRRNVVYVKWIWCPIMLVIRHIPENIFKKLKL